MTEAKVIIVDAVLDNDWSCVRCGSTVENPFDELCPACREPDDYQPPFEDWEHDGGGQ